MLNERVTCFCRKVEGGEESADEAADWPEGKAGASKAVAVQVRGFQGLLSTFQDEAFLRAYCDALPAHIYGQSLKKAAALFLLGMKYDC